MSSVRWPTGAANWQTQQMSRTERRGTSQGSSYSHSWWWDSHNAPKNSKWLEDNLNEMDAKVKAMLKLIEEDADSFAKRAEMYYKRRPELVSSVEDFYRAYRSLAERYDQLTGHVRQIPQEIQVQYGLWEDASPGSPGSGGSFRRRAAGFSAFANTGNPKVSKAKARKHGSDSSSSSSSDSDADAKHISAQHSDELLGLRLYNEQLKKDLEHAFIHQQALESRLTEIQGELKTLQQENVQLHQNYDSSHSEVAALEAEIERLTKENRVLGEERNLALHNVERLQLELEVSQGGQRGISTRLEASDLTVRDLEGRIKELESRITLLNEELVSSAVLCEHQNLELGSLSETLAEQKRSLQSRIEELEAALADERHRSVELQVVLEKRLIDNGQQLQQVQAALARVEKERADVGKLLSKKELSFLTLQEDSNSMQVQMTNQLSVLEEEKQSLFGRMEELQAAFAAVLSEKIQGTKLLDGLEKRVIDLQQELSQAKQKANVLSHELAGRVAVVSQLEELIRSRDDDLSKLGMDLELSIFEASRLRHELEDKFAAIRGLEGEVEEGGNQLAALREEFSVKYEEGHVLKEQVDLLIKEKLSISQETSLLLVEIERLKRESQEVAGILSEKASYIVNLEMQSKFSVKEFEEKQAHHVQQYQLLTTEKGRLELECANLRDANSKFELELASQCQHAHRVELDLKVAEGAAALSMEEVVKLKVDLVSEAHRLKIAEDKCLVQEQLVFDLQDENARFLARVEELEARDKTLQEELKGFLRNIDQLCQEKKSCDMDVRTRNDEPSEIEILSKESKVITETIFALRIGITKLEIYLSNCTEELQSLQHVRGDYNILLCEHESTVTHLQALRSRNEELESQVGILGQENVKFHEQLLASIKDSDQLSLEMLREKKELYEKLVIEGDHVLKLKKELELLKEERAGNGRVMDNFQRKIERLNLSIQEITLAKDQKEKSLRDELQSHAAKKAVWAKKLNEAHELVSIEKAEVMRHKEENDRKGRLLLKLEADHECISSEKQRNLDEHFLTLSSLEKLKEQLHHQQNENESVKVELRSRLARIQELETTIVHLEKEKHAFSVEIASTAVLMTDAQKRANDLQEEIRRLRQELTSSNEELQEKTEKVKKLLSMCGDLQEQKSALSTEVELKLQAFGILDASFCDLKGEHVSLVDKYEFVTKEAAAGANMILKLQEEISQLKSEKEAQIQVLMHRKADIQRLQEDFVLVRNSEEQLKKVLDAKVQEVNQLKEELIRLKAAKLVFYEEQNQKAKSLEVELKRMELVVIGFRHEKNSLSEQNAIALRRCSDLEATCKRLQQQLGDQNKERDRLESQLSLMEELTKEAHHDEEMARLMQERVANKQREIEQVQSINEDLKETVRKFESEVESLKAQIMGLQQKNTLLHEELSTKASLVQLLDQSLTSLKGQKIVFEGGIASAVGNPSLVQIEVDKLLEKISKLNGLLVAKAEELQNMEGRICQLQVSNLNQKEEISGFAKKEKSYIIAVRFIRAEFFCVAQRVKTMREEKLELARLAELATNSERKKNSEVMSGLHQELAFLREENKRQRTIILDRAEEKREAIRQLCATIDYLQSKNRRLERVINSVRDKIQTRIAASRARRR